MKYRHLTSFYGSVERSLALTEKGEPRYYDSVQSAVQEAIKLGETGPFSLVTRVELIPDENRGATEPAVVAGGPPPIYWTPPVKKERDPIDTAKFAVRQQLIEETYSGLLNMGTTKGIARSTVSAMPEDCDTLTKALNWCFRNTRR